MKKFIFLLSTLSLCTFSYAQFDERFYFPNKEWNPIMQSIEFEEYNFKVEKDIKLNGILMRPKGESKGEVLFLHGAGGNVSTYMEMTKPLVKRGYTVFMIDFRGYGKSDGTPKHLNIELDAPKVFDEVMGLKEFEGKKIIVYGASMGTQAAGILARERASQIRLLIIDGGITSFTDIAVASAQEEQKNMIRQFLVSPYALQELIKNTKGLKKWIIHSKEDSGVPYEMGQTLYQNAAEPKSMWTYEGEHLQAIIKHTDTFFEKLEALLQEENTPKSEDSQKN